MTGENLPEGVEYSYERAPISYDLLCGKCAKPIWRSIIFLSHQRDSGLNWSGYTTQINEAIRAHVSKCHADLISAGDVAEITFQMEECVHSPHELQQVLSYGNAGRFTLHILGLDPNMNIRGES